MSLCCDFNHMARCINKTFNAAIGDPDHISLQEQVVHPYGPTIRETLTLLTMGQLAGGQNVNYCTD